ncbi:MAG TPA: glycosyltransferase family 4 protein [Thermoanaerobaculaceae bacterium]|nr:glycosyltransferase family 4 protein [Thermoanaerobaculaceae bacterium]
MSAPVSVLYLLEDTALFGGVKIVLNHANLLARRGHRVTVASKGARPAWFPVDARFLQVGSFSAAELPDADLTVATFWTTVAPAAALGRRCVHYCQGFEASYTHNAAEHPAILDAYRIAMPRFALAPHLAKLVRSRFGQPARVVPPALEPEFRPRFRWRPRRLPRVLVVGPFEIDWKGVAAALDALGRLRASGQACRVVRVSQWPLSDAERAVLAPDEFHCHLAPGEVARVVRSADLFLAPSWEQEGFGLPVLEAMASGVPTVASDISAFRDFAATGALLVPADRPAAFADAGAALLGDAARWRALRSAGIAAAGVFREAIVAGLVEDALEWALAVPAGGGA